MAARESADRQTKALSETADGIVGSIREAVRLQADGIRSALEDQSRRQPVEVDAEAVGKKILEFLADSEQAHQLFARVPGGFFEEKSAELSQLLKDLPWLFDAIEGPLETWNVGDMLSDDERTARSHVVGVLHQIRRKFQSWRQLHRIDEVPGRDVEDPSFDQYWHRRIEVETTDDPQKHGTIARVVKPGYSRDGDRLRRAEVVVFGPPVGDGPAADPVDIENQPLGHRA